MPFTFIKTNLEGPLIVEPRRFKDERGYFAEIYKRSEFIENGILDTFLQDNMSVSNKYVLRGLHYQIPPMEQGKLVRVMEGKVFDVVVDIRKSSKALGQWVGVELSAKNGRMFWIPPGFAHGFISLEDNSIVEYKTTNEYSKDHERSIIWNDTDIGINWNVDRPIISQKDLEAVSFSNADLFP